MIFQATADRYIQGNRKNRKEKEQDDQNNNNNMTMKMTLLAQHNKTDRFRTLKMKDSHK